MFLALAVGIEVASEGTAFLDYLELESCDGFVGSQRVKGDFVS